MLITKKIKEVIDAFKIFSKFSGGGELHGFPWLRACLAFCVTNIFNSDHFAARQSVVDRGVNKHAFARLCGALYAECDQTAEIRCCATWSPVFVHIVLFCLSPFPFAPPINLIPVSDCVKKTGAEKQHWLGFSYSMTRVVVRDKMFTRYSPCVQFCTSHPGLLICRKLNLPTRCSNFVSFALSFFSKGFLNQCLPGLFEKAFESISTVAVMTEVSEGFILSLKQTCYLWSLFRTT